MWSHEFLNLILTEHWACNQHVRSQRPSTRFPTSSFLPSHPGHDPISTGQDEPTAESSGSHLQGFVCFQKGARCHKPWVFQCYNWFSLSLEYKALLILFIPPESRHSLRCVVCAQARWWSEWRGAVFNTPLLWSQSMHSKKPSLGVLLLFSDLWPFATCFKRNHYTLINNNICI